ncbi:MAG: hypothetical protein OIF32_09865, partial [Campylobacterales bacterium]|nr:hypothetical protein [Campylobacterales bacterium]
DHDYMCHWDMGSSKNTYMFNINGSKITGQYDYTRDGSNYIANVIENPDATFFSSSNIRGLLTNNKENRNNTIESKENQLRKNNIYDSFYKEIEMLKTHNKNQIN